LENISKQKKLTIQPKALSLSASKVSLLWWQGLLKPTVPKAEI